MAGAPLGNKNASGSVYDLNEEAKALEEWSKKSDSLALVDYCVERDIYAQRVYEWRDKDPLYAEALKKAKLRIASRLRKQLHDKDNPYNYGLFMRDISCHDAFLHDHEESVKDKEAVRRASALKSETKAIEEEKQKVLDSINKNRKFPS